MKLLSSFLLFSAGFSESQIEIKENFVQALIPVTRYELKIKSELKAN